MASQTERTFFQGKRPWSTIKDRVLSTYLPPYLPKVASLKRRIVIVDAFAGPGRYKDGSIGSPVLIRNQAEAAVPGKYLAIFVNSRKDHHNALTSLMRPSIDKGAVLTVHETAADLLHRLASILEDDTLLLYLDPFGLTGCEFALLTPFLERRKDRSTEILVNIQTQAIHRLAALTAERNRPSQVVDALQNRLTAVLGGNYWRPILSDDYIANEDKVGYVVDEYMRMLAEHLPYTGSCPVREQEGKTIKYRMVFCSRHPDALELMNDTMCKAYNMRMHEARVVGTLFEGSSWEADRDLSKLPSIVLSHLRHAGVISRRRLWLMIIARHFMIYQSKEFRQSIRHLIESGIVCWIDARGTGRLNDDSLLYASDQPPGLTFKPTTASRLK